MYRRAARGPRPPTRIVYSSRHLRLGRALLLSVAMFLIGFAALGTCRISHVVCLRSENVCTIDAYGLVVGDRRQEVALDQVRNLDVEERTGSKGGRYALARLVLASGESVDVGGGGFVPHFDTDSASIARSEMTLFLADETREQADIWLRSGTVTLVFFLAFGVCAVVVPFFVMREQVRQLRPIEVVVDHDRQVVLLPRGRVREVPFDAIEDVEIESGRALYWASNKNEYIQGWRLAVVTKSDRHLPLTPDFRAGPHTDHEAARRRILVAMGRLDES